MSFVGYSSDSITRASSDVVLASAVPGRVSSQPRATMGADGCIEGYYPNVSYGACCPDPLEVTDACGFACAFINLLPSGPLWDRAKTEALDWFNSNKYTDDGCELTGCPPDEITCQSLVAYAVYVSRILTHLLAAALCPALRESDPHTAVTTLDDWLERLGWEDCYKQQCRKVLVDGMWPYEVEGVNGPILCPVDTPPALECAVKSAIVKALTRAQMGGIKNLCWINWVIEPLGAVVERYVAPPGTVPTPDDPCKPCGDPMFTICDSRPTLQACRTDLHSCGLTGDPGTVQAYFDIPDCRRVAGMPDQIWPGVIAAECIVRSLLPQNCPTQIIRSCGCSLR